MWPPAKIIAISTAPIASGAITPGAAASPVQPIVNTRKNVPMNSTAYRRMAPPFVLIVGPLPRPTSTNEASYRGAADDFRRRAPDFRPERRWHEAGWPPRLTWWHRLPHKSTRGHRRV